MVSKVSPELKKKLLAQKKAMGSQLIIDNRSFQKGKFYILPSATPEEVPGQEYISVYCDAIKTGATSPATFGLRCPIVDFFENIKRTGTKEEKDAAYKLVGVTHEYWLSVLDSEDIGTSSAPNIKILRARKTVYQAIINRLVDDDIGEDVTNIDDPRPALIKKTPNAENPKKSDWSVTFLDKAPISEDADYIEGLRAAVGSFDVRAKFYKVDWEKLNKVYHKLTGDDIPDHYKEQGDGGGTDEGGTTEEGGEGDGEQTEAAPKAAAKPATKAPPAKMPAKPAAKGPAKKAEPEPEPAEPEADENGIIVGQTRVKLTLDGEECEGVVTAFNSDDGNYDVEAKDPKGETGVWTCALEDFTIIEDEEPAAEPEPAPVKKGPQPKGKTAAPAADSGEEKSAPQPAGKVLPKKPVTVGKAGASLKDRVAKK